MNPLKLLTELTRPGVTITDSAGVPVSPRTQMEINCFASAVQIRNRMRELESGRHFPGLQKEYRELKKKLEMYCSEVFLEDFLNTI